MGPASPIEAGRLLYKCKDAAPVAFGVTLGIPQRYTELGEDTSV